MDRTIKQVIAVIASLIILLVSVWGSYLPMRKAEMFIASLQSLQTQPVSSLGDLEGRVSSPLDYPSPIGQEELVRNLANSVLGFVQNNQNPSSSQEMLNFLGSYYNPILVRGKGMSFSQDLYLAGAINEVAFVKTGAPEYLARAKQYYLQGNQVGPTRPQPLYGLFDVYRFENDATNTILTGQKILSLWPDDKNVGQGLAAFAAQAQAQVQTQTPKVKVVPSTKK